MLSGCKALPGESRVIRSRCVSELQLLPRGMCRQRAPAVSALHLHACVQGAMPGRAQQAAACAQPALVSGSTLCTILGSRPACRWVLPVINELVLPERSLSSSQQLFLMPAKHAVEPSLLFCPHRILLCPEHYQQFGKHHRKTKNSELTCTTWVT